MRVANPRVIVDRPGRADQSSRRILLISYHFPPDPTIGARRWERLAPFVTERRWGLDVIACAPSAGADLSRLEALPSGIRVFGVPAVTLGVERVERVAWRLYTASRDRFVRSGQSTSSEGKPPAEVAAPRSEWVERTAIGWLRAPRDFLRAYWTLLQHAKYGGWADRAATLAHTIIEPGVHFAIVTSGPPHRTHEAGRAVSDRSGLPFVMDMRDPWSLSARVHESVASPLWFRLAKAGEAAAVRQASLVVANTEAAREAVVAAYPDVGARVITVMNGSDDDPPLPKLTRGDRFTIVYAGTIYIEQHPRSLLRAASDVVRQLGLRPADFGIDFLGTDVPGKHPLLEMAREEGIADFVSTQPPRSHAEALEFQAAATMHVTFPGWDSSAIPAKIFECVRFDAWLLALADPGSATDRLLQATNADVVPPDDRKAIAEVLRKRYEEYRRGLRPRRVVTDDRFSRRSQAQILLDAIARLPGVAPE